MISSKKIDKFADADLERRYPQGPCFVIAKLGPTINSVLSIKEMNNLLPDTVKLRSFTFIRSPYFPVTDFDFSDLKTSFASRQNICWVKEGNIGKTDFEIAVGNTDGMNLSVDHTVIDRDGRVTKQISNIEGSANTPLVTTTSFKFADKNGVLNEAIFVGRNANLESPMVSMNKKLDEVKDALKECYKDSKLYDETLLFLENLTPNQFINFITTTPSKSYYNKNPNHKSCFSVANDIRGSKDIPQEIGMIAGNLATNNLVENLCTTTEENNDQNLIIYGGDGASGSVEMEYNQYQATLNNICSIDSQILESTEASLTTAFSITDPNLFLKTLYLSQILNNTEKNSEGVFEIPEDIKTLINKLTLEFSNTLVDYLQGLVKNSAIFMEQKKDILHSVVLPFNLIDSGITAPKGYVHIDDLYNVAGVDPILKLDSGVKFGVSVYVKYRKSKFEQN